MSSGLSSGNWDVDPIDPEISSWPGNREASDVAPGLYELSPAHGHNAKYNITLYAKAIHFMDLDGSKQAETEFSKIVNAFMNIFPALFPDGRVLLLWNVTLGFTTDKIMEQLGHSPTIYIILEPDQNTRDWFHQFQSRRYRGLQYQTRAIVFISARSSEEWDPIFQIVQNFQNSARHPIDYIACRWGSRSIANKPGKLKIINMPSVAPSGLFRTPSRSSSFRRKHRTSPEPHADEQTGPHPGYFWLDRLPHSLSDLHLNISSRLSPNNDNWMIESAQLFLHSFHRVIETIRSRGRSVWFMVRPLENRNLPGPSAAHVSFSHWGILISDMTRSQLEDRLEETSTATSGDSIWGDLHELRNICGSAKYECCTYRARDNRRATKLDYLGQTEIADEELFEFGTAPFRDILITGHELIRSNPKYHLLKNNCQVWVEKFLNKVCPSAEVEKTLAEVLRSSSK